MSVRRHYLLSIANQGAQLGAVALIFMCIARALGPEGKGTVAVVIALPGMLVALAHCSLPAGTVYYGSRDPVLLGRLAANGLLFCLVVGLPLMVLTWGGRDLAVQWFRLDALDMDAGLWRGVVWLLLPTLLVESGTSVLVARRRFGRLAWANAAVGLLFVPVFAVVLFGARGSAETACLLYAAYRATRAVAVWALLPWRDAGPVTPDARVFRDTLGFSLQGHLGTVMQLFVYRLDLLILNALAGVAAAGLYSVATYLAELLGHIPNALRAVVLPEVAGRAPEEGRVLAARACRQTLWGSVGCAVALGLVAPALVPAMFGSAFRPAVTALWVLLPGVVALALARVVVAAVVGGGWPRVGTYAGAIALALTVGLDLLLIPRWGMLGAALASTIAYTAQSAFVVATLVRQTGLPLREIVAFRRADFVLIREMLKRVARG